MGNINTTDIDDIVNSDNSKKLRQAFLSGERHEACKACWNYESLSGNVSDVRLFNNKQGGGSLPDIINHTDVTGKLKNIAPAWLDILWTNKCNFACLGCSPDLSSTIAQNYAQSYQILHPDHKPVPDSITWNNNSRKIIDYVLQHSDTIKLIHLNGGEPFLSEDLYELLEELLKRGLNNTIKIWSHTNGSITQSYRGVDIIQDYLVHWGKNCSITISNDGVGGRGEYIRYGYRDTKWLETFNKIKDSGIALTIQSCLNIFNVLTIGDWNQWMKDNCMINGRVPSKIVPWSNKSVAITLLAADTEYRQLAINTLTELDLEGVFPFWAGSIESAVRSLSDASPDYYDQKYIRAFVLGTESIDRERNTDYDQTFPELVEFRNRLRKTVL
jgi:hypothetical protein